MMFLHNQNKLQLLAPGGLHEFQIPTITSKTESKDAWMDSLSFLNSSWVNTTHKPVLVGTV